MGRHLPPGRGQSLRRTAARILTTVTAGVFAAAPVIAAAQAHAAERPEAVKAPGQVTLFSQPDFTGRSERLAYNDCTQTRLHRVLPAASFDNRPPINCQVQLGGTAAGWYTLCAGRDVVPVAVRHATFLRIQPGVSRPCAATAVAPASTPLG